jgi:hypothetical protein
MTTYGRVEVHISTFLDLGTTRKWIIGVSDFSSVRYSENQKIQCFGNWICFRPQVRREAYTLLGPLERVHLNHWTLVNSRRRNRVDVSPSPQDENRSSFRNIVFLVFRITDDERRPKTSNSECTPSSEPFRGNYFSWMIPGRNWAYYALLCFTCRLCEQQVPSGDIVWYERMKGKEFKAMWLMSNYYIYESTE